MDSQSITLVGLDNGLNGMQDIPAILGACEKVGAQWVVVEQDSPAKGDTPLNSVTLSREYLKTLGW